MPTVIDRLDLTTYDQQDMRTKQREALIAEASDALIKRIHAQATSPNLNTDDSNSLETLETLVSILHQLTQVDVKKLPLLDKDP